MRKVEYIKEFLNINNSFDVGYREYNINNVKLYFFFINGLGNNTNILNTIKNIISFEINNDKDIFEDIRNNIIAQQFSKTKDINIFLNNILSGMLGLYIIGQKEFINIDLRDYPSRSPQEPDTERVVRGSRDGFIESIAVNVSLIRRRIRTNSLVTKLYRIGEKSQTDVCLVYLNDICDLKLVEYIDNLISNIKIDELSMSDKALEELLLKQKFNPYPMVRYTERPDNVASHLFQGLVAIVVDNSPSVILAPITFFDHLQHAEEYRQTPLVGTFLRLIRFSGVFLALFLVPLWTLVSIYPEYLPNFLSFIGPEKTGNIPIILQIFIAEIGIEFLRMAAIHTPNPLSTAMGLIAGILVGEIAVNVGLFMPEIILYIAISQIGNYATPSYELSLANKISKLFFIICVYFFKLPGLVLSITTWLLYLSTLKSFNKPYLFPLVPLNIKKLSRVIIRYPKKSKK